MGRAHGLSLPHRYVTGTDARILPAKELGAGIAGPENRLLITSHNSVSDFSGQSCSSQTRMSPQFFSFPACSHLCFITAIQPDHSAHLSIASSHLENPSHSNRDSSS